MSIPVVLPLSLVSYNGGSQSEEYSIHNSIDLPADDEYEQPPPHCSKNGNNFDLVLQYRPADPSQASNACTLTHIVISHARNCSDLLSSAVLFVSADEQPPAIERYADLYTDCTAQQYDDMAPAVRSEHGAVCYFDVDMEKPQTVLNVPPEQGKCVRFIHLRLIRGGEANIDMGRLAAVGFPYPSVDTPPPVISLYQPMLEQLKLALRQWQPGTVQPFQYHYQSVLLEMPFMLVHYGDKQDDESRANAADLSSILDILAATNRTLAVFSINKSTIERLPCGQSLRSFTSWDEEDDFSEARIAFVDKQSKVKLMADRETIARLPTTESAYRERKLALMAWYIKCISSISSDEEAERQDRQPAVNSEQQPDPELDDSFLATLLQFAQQAAGGMMIGLIAVKQCTSVNQYRAAFSGDDTYNILQQLMLNYWNTNWTKLHTPTPTPDNDYIDRVYGAMMAAGPFEHRTCLHMFLWEYTVNLLRESVQMLLRSYMGLSGPLESCEEFINCVRALIYSMVETSQRTCESCRQMRSADELRHWGCAEASKHHQCHEHPPNAPFHEYIMAHWGLRNQAE